MWWTLKHIRETDDIKLLMNEKNHYLLWRNDSLSDSLPCLQMFLLFSSLSVNSFCYHMKVGHSLYCEHESVTICKCNMSSMCHGSMLCFFPPLHKQHLHPISMKMVSYTLYIYCIFIISEPNFNHGYSFFFLSSEWIAV